MQEYDETPIIEESSVLDKSGDIPKSKLSQITEEDKENFFKSVISDQPFYEKVSLFGGKMTITLKTMTVEENNDVIAQINKDKDTEVAENNDAYFITISTYRLGLCLAEIDGVKYQTIDKSTFKETDKGVTYVRARAADMQKWPTFKLSAFLAAFNDFEEKVTNLTNEVKTENFWTASA
jgi:hypothetical protein